VRYYWIENDEIYLDSKFQGLTPSGSKVMTILVFAVLYVHILINENGDRLGMGICLLEFLGMRRSWK
jgi:hypothetical protein